MLHNDTIAEFPRAQQKPSAVTLDTLAQAINNWRANKKSMQERIPDSIWEQVLILSEKYSEASLRAATGISSAQFRRKLAEHSTPATPKKPSAQVDFCEVKQIKPNPPLYKPNKILATNTLIVEFCRDDGRIMKIHTTTDSFAELMKAFFEGA